ncbi:hypothetical protein SAMN02927924_01402 [Sphingobium faniae]|nr:hypothetical protein SAMN02927924_01402 [Sphingobium faniae]
MTLYSEASYFDGNHCQHVADREDRQRLERKDEIARQLAATQEETRKFSRLSNPLPRSQVQQFERSMSALLALPRLRRQLREIEHG